MVFGRKKKVEEVKEIPTIRTTPQVKTAEVEDAPETALEVKADDKVQLVTSEQLIHLKLNTLIEEVGKQSKYLDLLAQEIEVIRKIAESP